MMWLMGLCVLYPEYCLLFQLLGLLDIMREWMAAYRHVAVGIFVGRCFHMGGVYTGGSNGNNYEIRLGEEGHPEPLPFLHL